MGFSLPRLLQGLQHLPRPGRYLVAYSGGLDSAVLLHALDSLGARRGAPLAAVHVDHGLSPASSRWAEHCERFCRMRSIPLTIHHLELQPAAGVSPEALAREARYERLGASMQPGDALVTAHHRDDQAETVLLRLLRGSGPSGLAGMAGARPFGKGWLLRPLLDFGRADLARFARSEGIEWIDDASNLDTRFDRNYVRHDLMPVLQKRWPAAAATIARAALFCREADAIVGERAAEDIAAAQTGGGLLVSSLLSLSAGRQRAALRHWLSRRGLPVPDHRKLEELLRQLGAAREDTLPLVVWPGVEARRWRGILFAHAPLPPMPAAGSAFLWDGQDIELPGELGRLVRRGTGLPEHLVVRFRGTGESAEVRGGRRPLKKIFQMLGIPPWLRGRVPLVYSGRELLAAGDCLYSDGWPGEAALAWEKGRGWPEDSVVQGRVGGG